MEDGNLLVVFYFPHLIYQTVNRMEDGNLVIVFYFPYLRTSFIGAACTTLICLY